MIKNTLVWVDRQLAASVAAKMAGVLQTKGSNFKTRGAVNWLIAAELSSERSSSITADIRELLPEDLIYHFYEYIPDRGIQVSQIASRLSTSSKDGYKPGTVVSIEGNLLFPKVKFGRQKITPFDQPDIEVPEVHFHGDLSIGAELTSDKYTLPVFFPAASKYQILYCNQQPVEISAVLRWVPPYSPGGAASLNLALSPFALWLR